MIPSNIESLKATLAKRNGFAQTNYFSIFMSLPILTLNPGSILSNVLAGNTRVDQVVNDPRDIGLLCESCSLPGRTISTVDYQTVKQSVKLPYSFLNEDVTFTFLLTQDYYMKDVFDEWMSKIMDFNNYKLHYKSDYTSDVIIEQLTKQGTPAYSVRLENAYPVAVSAIELDNTGENTIQKITITMTYDNFVTEGVVTSTLNKLKEIKEQVVDLPSQLQRALTNINF